jgi:hypothetical protein
MLVPSDDSMSLEDWSTDEYEGEGDDSSSDDGDDDVDLDERPTKCRRGAASGDITTSETESDDDSSTR